MVIFFSARFSVMDPNTDMALHLSIDPDSPSAVIGIQIHLATSKITVSFVGFNPISSGINLAFSLFGSMILILFARKILVSKDFFRSTAGEG